jgi:hypothetical protein
MIISSSSSLSSLTASNKHEDEKEKKNIIKQAGQNRHELRSNRIQPKIYPPRAEPDGDHLAEHTRSADRIKGVHTIDADR